MRVPRACATPDFSDARGLQAHHRIRDGRGDDFTPRSTEVFPRRSVPAWTISPDARTRPRRGRACEFHELAPPPDSSDAPGSQAHHRIRDGAATTSPPFNRSLSAPLCPGVDINSVRIIPWFDVDLVTHPPMSIIRTLAKRLVMIRRVSLPRALHRHTWNLNTHGQSSRYRQTP